MDIYDYAYDVPRPLLLSLENLGELAGTAIRFMNENNATPSEAYFGKSVAIRGVLR